MTDFGVGVGAGANARTFSQPASALICFNCTVDTQLSWGVVGVVVAVVLSSSLSVGRALTLTVSGADRRRRRRRTDSAHITIRARKVAESAKVPTTW